MELVVGVNSYMTLEDADIIVKNNFIKSDAERQYWNSLDNEDKSVLIIRATKDIESTCLFKGHLVVNKQTLSFPRYINNIITDCPEDIKVAIIMQILKDGILKQSDEIKMQELGVKSFADGTGASISFDNVKALQKIGAVYRDVYERFLRHWTICV